MFEFFNYKTCGYQKFFQHPLNSFKMCSLYINCLLYMNEKQNHIYMWYTVKMTLNTLRNIDGSFTANLYCCFQKKVSWHLKREKQINKILDMKTNTAKQCNVHFPWFKQGNPHTKLTDSASCSNPVSWCSISSSRNSLIIWLNEKHLVYVLVWYPPFCILLKKTKTRWSHQMHKYSKWSPNTHALFVFLMNKISHKV